jgi:hypothetical protein
MTQAEIDQAAKDRIGTNPKQPLLSNPDIAQALAITPPKQPGWPTTNPPHPPIGYIAAKASDGRTHVIHGGDP